MEHGADRGHQQSRRALAHGEKVVEYEFASPAWTTMVAESKFKAWPSYGKASRGHIVLQDHGDHVEFRNIKIKPGV